MTTVVFASGGTGGHIIPALTTARYLKTQDSNLEVLFIGAGSELEKKLIQSSEFSYVAINASGVVGKGVAGIFKFFLSFPKGIIALRSLYKEKKVGLVIGFGGYPSVLPCLAANSLKVPTYIFEQNGKAGLANRILATFARLVFAVPGVVGLENKKIIKVLNPVRQEIRDLKKLASSKPRTSLNILIMGGSQGAATLNSAIFEIRDLFIKEKCKVTLQVGKRDFDRMSNLFKGEECFKVVEYIENMGESLVEADLVICRAGASTAAELTVLKKPTIFVPLAIAHGHQKFNVLHLVSGGASLMCEQTESLSKDLSEKIKLIFSNQEILTNMERAFDIIPELKDVEDGAVVISRSVLELLKQGAIYDT